MLATVALRKVTGKMGRSLTTKPRWYVDVTYQRTGRKSIHGPYFRHESAQDIMEALKGHYQPKPA